MNKPFLTLWLLCLSVCLCACTLPRQRATELDETLRRYEQFIRWSEWETALGLVHPDYLAEHPMTRLDMERLKLFRVTNYTVRSAIGYDDGAGMRQTVEIRLVNKARAVEGVIVDQQDWRYDESLKAWLLHTGLPDVTRRD